MWAHRGNERRFGRRLVGRGADLIDVRDQWDFGDDDGDVGRSDLHDGCAARNVRAMGAAA
jgi:hypothetical protein